MCEFWPPFNPCKPGSFPCPLVLSHLSVMMSDSPWHTCCSMSVLFRLHVQSVLFVILFQTSACLRTLISSLGWLSHWCAYLIKHDTPLCFWSRKSILDWTFFFKLVVVNAVLIRHPSRLCYPAYSWFILRRFTYLRWISQHSRMQCIINPLFKKIFFFFCCCCFAHF